MKLQNLATLAALVPYVLGYPHLTNFPEHRSLAGLSPEEVQTVMQLFKDSMPGPQPLPPPINDTSSKLVNDPDHPFEPTRPDDMRGPCPGLNTLASHGYINRNGIATPTEIITAVQEGFNMGYQFASFLTYSAFIVDGNVLTNKMSIGANTTQDGRSVPGIDTHGNFEGDASITRQDYYLGNNFYFNEGLFQVLVHAAHAVGGGAVTIEAGVLDRRLRVEDSIARNPQFSYVSPRFVGATAETGFAIAMFTHNQTADTTTPLDLDAARSFFQHHRFPDGFYRRQDPYEFPKVTNLTQRLIQMVGVRPGQNNGVNNYIVDTEDCANFCYFYQKQANSTVQRYHNPSPILVEVLKKDLELYYQTLGDPQCEQMFPFGR
ncbi:heme-thiolate peroxidase [Tylopilus felleus]